MFILSTTRDGSGCMKMLMLFVRAIKMCIFIKSSSFFVDHQPKIKYIHTKSCFSLSLSFCLFIKKTVCFRGTFSAELGASERARRECGELAGNDNII